MDEKESLMKCNFELLHKQFQQIKKIQKPESSNENNDVVIDQSEEMKNLIQRMIEMIDSMMTPDSTIHLRLLAMKITLFYERSKLLISLGEEKIAQEVLVAALDGLKDVIFESEIIFLAFRIINHYAYLLSKQGDFDKPKELLEFAESTYKSLKGQNSTIQFYASDDLFLPDIIVPPSTDSSNKLERLVTNNLQMLGFIYNKQEFHDKFAEYHHEVLRRQLEMQDGDVTMWALKSARLASYFLSKNRFKYKINRLEPKLCVLSNKLPALSTVRMRYLHVIPKIYISLIYASISRFREARHHLAASIYMLYGYEKELKAMEPSDNMIVKWDELQQRFADIAKCWVKYGLFLFSVSKTSIVSLFCGEPNQILEKLWTSPFKSNDECKPTTSKEMPMHDISADQKSEVPVKGFGDTLYENSQIPFDVTDPVSGTLPNLLENMQQNISGTSEKINIEEYQGPFLLFPSLDITEYEDAVTASFVETTAQARALFLYTHSWLKRAKVFFTLRDHPMEYVNAILDLSELYRYLAFYEEDIESQYAVQKLRADALETLSAVLREVRPQCYMAVSVELLRELAEVQLEMMGLNLRRIYVAQEAVPETSDVTLHKMEALADIHSRLEQFGDNLGHNTDPVDSGLLPVSDMAGDVRQYVNT